MTQTAFAARHSCDSPEWYTPSPFVEAAREVMGEIDLDPASHEEANHVVKAKAFFSVEDNGLAKGWYGCVFLNPPGGLVPEFWHKFIGNEFVAGIWIGYSLEQLQTLQCIGAQKTPLNFSMCVPSKRIAFVENAAKKDARIEKLIALGKKPNQKSQPSHANYISYIGSQPELFKRVFQQFGQVVTAMNLSALLAFNARCRTRTVILAPTSLTGRRWHGTYAYAKGCGCEVCRTANRDAQRRRRKRAA